MTKSVLIACFALAFTHSAVANDHLLTPGANSGPAVVSVDPTQDVASVVSAAAPGTTFYFAPGTYRGVTITPKTGDTFIGVGSVTLTGSVPIGGWTRSGPYWTATGFPANGFAGPGAGNCNASSPNCAIPNDLYVNGFPSIRASSKSEVTSGQFYTDGAGSVWITDNPTGKTTTAGRLLQAFAGNNNQNRKGPFANNVTIQNITVREYASRANWGAIEAFMTSGWSLVNVNAVFNHGAGLDGGSNMTVQGGNYSNNGQVGILVWGWALWSYQAENIVVNGVTANNNNYAGFSEGWGTGGIKMLQTTYATVEDATVSYNIGDGIWCDTNCLYFNLTRNNISYNHRNGIAYEASFDATISDNMIAYSPAGEDVSDNDRASLLIDDSQNVAVKNNSFIVNNNADGILLVDEARGSAGSFVVPYNENNIIEGNTVICIGQCLTGGYSNGSSSEYTSRIYNRSNSINNNKYIGKDPGNLTFQWNNKDYWNMVSPPSPMPIETGGIFVYKSDPATYLVQ